MSEDYQSEDPGVTEEQPSSQTEYASEQESDAAAQPAADASGSDTPTEQASAAPGPVPYTRFTEVNERMKAAEARASQFQQWEDDLSALQDAGLTPGQIRQVMANPQAYQQPQAPPDPNAQYSQFLAQQGIDEYLLPPETNLALRSAFQAQQAVTQLQQQSQQSQRQAYEDRRNTEFNALVTEYPEMQGKRFAGLLKTASDEAYANGRSGTPLRTFAAELRAEFETHVLKPRLAEYSSAKRDDARVPVTAGGNAPGPAPRGKNPHTEMTREERDAYFGIT